MAERGARIESLGENFGYASSLEDAHEFIRELETKSTTKFVVCRVNKDFGATDYSKSPHKICWEDQKDAQGARISFTGVPYFCLGTKLYDCQHGADKNTAVKKRKREENEATTATKRQRIIRVPSRKVNCPARIKLREILLFPEFKIDKDTQGKRRATSQKLRDALKAGTANPERRIYIEFPSDSDHTNHSVGEEGGMSQPVDKRVINRIHELVSEGLTNVNQVKSQLDFYVKAVLFRDKELPQTTNRRFYPTKKDIHSHIFRAKLKNPDSSHTSPSSQVQKIKSRKESNTQADQRPSSSVAVTINDTLVELNNDTHTGLTNETCVALPNDTVTALPDASVERQKCQDLLEQIQQLRFVIKDEETLRRLNSKLQEVIDEMQLCCCVGQSGDHNYVEEIVDEHNGMLQRGSLLQAPYN